MTNTEQNIITKSWEETHDNLFAFILSKVKIKEDAEDILQEVFIKSIEKAEDLDANANINGWIYTVTRNKIMDFFRSKGTEIDLDDELLPVVSNHVKNEEFQDKFCCLEPHIEELPELYKDVIVLSDLKNLPHKNIADQLGLSVSAVKKRVVRGREMLKSKFISCCNYHLNSKGLLVGDPDCQNPDCNH